MFRKFTLAGLLSALIAASTLIGASPAAADTTGLVGYWQLDAGEGTLTADSSGFGNDGTVQGNAAWVPGHSGSALSFDGSGRGWVDVPDSSSLEPTPAVTVTAWVKASGSPGGYRYILAKGATGCTAASYGLYTAASGGLEFYVSSGRGTVYRDSPDAGGAVWDGRWHFIAGTYDGTTVRLYLDGAQVGAGTRWGQPLAYTLSDSNDLFIGNYAGCRSENDGFRGTIDEVTIWNRALSAAEIAGDAPNPQPIAPTPGPPVTGSQPQGGRPSTSPGTPGGAPQPTTGTPRGGGPATTPTGDAPPQVAFLNLIPAMFRLGAGSQTTINYVVGQSDVANLTVLRALPGVLRHGRCVKPFAVRGGSYPRTCTRFVTIGTFTHTDTVGRNRFRFGGLRGLKLTTGHYRLAVTPYAHQKRGQTATAGFWVLP